MNPQPWFTNRGQMLQLAATTVGAVIAVLNFWLQFSAHQFFSVSAIASYTILFLAIVAFVSKNYPVLRRIAFIGILVTLSALAAWQLEDHLVVQQRDAMIASLHNDLEKSNQETTELRRQLADAKKVPQLSREVSPRPLPKPNPRQFTELSFVKQELRSQRQAILFKIEPPLPQTEIVELWVLQGNNVWHKSCEAPMERATAPNFWSAQCTFGLPEKQDARAGENYFSIGAFHNTTLVSDPGNGITKEEWAALPYPKALWENIPYRGPAPH